ncbi:DUF3300 domain-containing protein [Aestuariivirga sp.]|uniref:DUF3300 domain-containing protein n=1 Tax=Aestuariivirga sp. TaxID=2650926 RepID=UPI00391A4C6A
MTRSHRIFLSAAVAAMLALGLVPARSQTDTASTAQGGSVQTPEPLSDEELEVLVARIALYPDELVAVISAASLYPLQIIEADRFLDEHKKNSELKPKATWDGSVVSLLNYPEVVQMMSDDLDWTQMLGEAILNQQDGVLSAIQQLREKAVAENIIKTDDKVKVVEEEDNIVIQPASTEVIYVPQYPPEMLYEEDYPYEPVAYYPEPYPYYYSPGAVFFAGAITGAFWGAVIDWDDGFWGGDWDWNDGWGGDVDIDIDCNKCIIGSDFDGRININDVDWKNIDRSKIKFDRNQLSKIDRTKVKNTIKSSDRNRVKNKAANREGNRASTLPAKGGRPVKDVRASTLEGLKKQPGPKPGTKDLKAARPGDGKLQGAGTPGKKPASGKIDRPVGKKKPAAKVDSRPRNPSPVGEMKRGVDAKKQSNRGAKSMGGGGYKRPSGGVSGMKKRPMPRGGGGRSGGRGRR